MGYFHMGNRKRLCVMFCMTGSFMVTELIVGYYGDSLTLVADSFHMLNDVAALIVAFISITLSTRTWNRSTFGWARAEVIGAMINSVFLIALCFSIFVEAIKRFIHPEPITKPRWVFGVGVCGLVINLIGLAMFRDHAHSHGGSSSNERHNEINKLKIADQFDENVNSKAPDRDSSQMNMRGVFLHVLADTMASVAVIISASLVWATEDLRLTDPTCYNYIDYIDPSLSILICFLVLASTWPLLHQASIVLLQAVPETLRIEDLQKALESIQGVTDVHELHIWQLTGTRLYASVHFSYYNRDKSDEIVNEADTIFRIHGVHKSTIQLEFSANQAIKREGCLHSEIISPNRNLCQIP